MPADDTKTPDTTTPDNKPQELPPPVAEKATKGLKFTVKSLVGALKMALGLVDIIDSLVDGPIADTVFGIVKAQLQKCLVDMSAHSDDAKAVAQQRGLI